MLRSGSPSSAVGGFQFIRPTLQALKNQLGLTGNEIFDEKLQNRLADALLQARGFGKLMTGEMGHKSFINSVAKEWAGLPTTEGRSHYAGDGLNKSTVKLRSVLDALKEFREAGDSTSG
jgi:muramidase (phage lysozyme)